MADDDTYLVDADVKVECKKYLGRKRFDNEQYLIDYVLCYIEDEEDEEGKKTTYREKFLESLKEDYDIKVETGIGKQKVRTFAPC